MTDEPTEPAASPATPQKIARYGGRPTKVATAQDHHARIMKRPAETLHLAHHHLHPHGKPDGQ